LTYVGIDTFFGRADHGGVGPDWMTRRAWGTAMGLVSAAMVETLMRSLLTPAVARGKTEAFGPGFTAGSSNPWVRPGQRDRGFMQPLGSDSVLRHLR
jgi:hypothetical protein